MMLEAHRPSLDDLWFRQALLADEATMAYNAAWGGTIDFPREKWAEWYGRWLEVPETERYYRYLRHRETGRFVGEIAYRLDGEKGVYLCDVIVLAAERGKGYGAAFMDWALNTFRELGINDIDVKVVYDNEAIRFYEKYGFRKIADFVPVTGRADQLFEYDIMP